MTKTKKPRKLAHEILGFIAISALAALVLFLILSGVTITMVEEYVFYNDMPITEFDWMDIERLVLGGSVVLALCLFTVLFLSMLAERMVYIRKITRAIVALRCGEDRQPIPVEGNNELSELAKTVNYLSLHQKQVREKELALQKEKEELIRSLSHDIRTPLTAIMTYSEYLSDGEAGLSPEGKAQLELIRKKGQQIKELTDILLDGGRRNLEFFEDARLLIAQLAEEFSETLEDSFDLRIDLSAVPAFSGSFDAQELRRVFDNIRSNIQKYADPAQPVCLQATVETGYLRIRQENGIRENVQMGQGFGIGLQSIRRIVQHYGGSVQTGAEQGHFWITITLIL